MTDQTIWPHPEFHFSVEIEGGPSMSFQEISGLAVEAAPIEVREGDSKVCSTVRTLGMPKGGTVTCKQGVFTDDTSFWDWYSEIKMNTVTRKTLRISLLDQAGAATMAWTLTNAFPTRITGTDLKSEGNEVAIEAVDFVFERLTVETP